MPNQSPSQKMNNSNGTRVCRYIGQGSLQTHDITFRNASGSLLNRTLRYRIVWSDVHLMYYNDMQQPRRWSLFNTYRCILLAQRVGNAQCFFSTENFQLIPRRSPLIIHIWCGISPFPPAIWISLHCYVYKWIQSKDRVKEGESQIDFGLKVQCRYNFKSLLNNLLRKKRRGCKEVGTGISAYGRSWNIQMGFFKKIWPALRKKKGAVS